MTRETRVIDPTPCLVRHVRRAGAGEPSVTVLRAAFTAAAGSELEALNGRAGWQSAKIDAALTDDGTVTILFPNAAGDDGVLHRHRFALLTDPLYRVGEEWLELYREPISPDSLIAVMTPARWRMDRGSLELSGPDLMGLFTLARSSELDVWANAPRDVFEFYTRLPVATLAADLTGWSAAGAGVVDGWTYAGASSSSSRPGARLTADAGLLEHALEGLQADAWSIDARITWLAAPAGIGGVRLVAGIGAGASTIELEFTPAAAGGGAVTLEGNGITLPAGAFHAGGSTRRAFPGGCSLKILARGRWVYGFLEGELVAQAQRAAIAAPDLVRVDTFTAGGGVTDVVVERVDVETPLPFALRGADKGDRRLPGAPTPGGLRGRYWSEAAAASSLASSTSAAYLAACLDPLREPGDARLDATLQVGVAGAASWPAGAGGSGGAPLSARWTGAIYLDLNGNGRMLRLGALNGAARVWVGRTMLPADAVIDAWAGGAGDRGDLRSANLQAALGLTSGWYPLVVELVGDGGGAKITLEESALNGGGAPIAWAAVPASRLSPLGCYEETHRLESHRELLGALAEGFGYQWRVDPRTLESGEFPGQVVPRVRVGVDTDKIVLNDRATDLASEGDAMDAVDRLLIDAAGIADPKGAEQLTAAVVNDVAVAAGHLFLSTGAESLPEVSEENLLRQRADSLLALRAGPNEQIAARPQDAAQELTDTFPLTGALARRRWRPGDGLRLALEDLSVIDVTPRQLVAVSLPVYRDGVGAPSVGWRQRPRGIRAFLKRTARALYAGQRNYQGQTAVITGSWGTSVGGDGYSRAPLPDRLEDVVEATLVVHVVTGAGGTIEVNAANTGQAVTRVARYDVTRYVARETGRPRMFARIVGAASYEVHLELRIRL